MLDRAFDHHRLVLLHAYAGQGKSSTAIEFTRWYARTGGLGEHPTVLLTSFENHRDLGDILNQIGQQFARRLSNPTVEWDTVNGRNERIAVVKRILRLIPILWIWDNVEPVAGFPAGEKSAWSAEEQQDLRNFLHQIKEDNAGKVKILLTSRRNERSWLGDIPHRISMPPMQRSDAAEFAVRLAEDKRLSRSESAGWQPLIDYCAGNPLILRVLVGQVVKYNLRSRDQIMAFIEAIRNGENDIEDADEEQGREKSLTASLNYGFLHAFTDNELSIIALLHLFQGFVNVSVLDIIHYHAALPELNGTTHDELIALLKRVADIGLISNRSSDIWFTIHPALPWFLRQLFNSRYDGQMGHSSIDAATIAWVEAVCEWGHLCSMGHNRGERTWIIQLDWEEANLLYARSIARREKWLRPLHACTNALNTLYASLGRWAELDRLVAEIVPYFCTVEDEPVYGLEDAYNSVMSFRVRLLRDHHRDLAKAAALQQKHLDLARRNAAADLLLPLNVSLDKEQKNRLRTLSVCLHDLGVILFEQRKVNCFGVFLDSLEICRRIGDQCGQATAQLEIGNCHLELGAIRDLEAAEAAYNECLRLRNPSDGDYWFLCTMGIGEVYKIRSMDARIAGKPIQICRQYALEAITRYDRLLQVCPYRFPADRAKIQLKLGEALMLICRMNEAREHYEDGLQCAEKIGDRRLAGNLRYDIARMYVFAAQRESQPAIKKDIFLRALAYAEAALRDFQYFDGCAAEEETRVQDFINTINLVLAKLPQQ